MGKLLKNKKLLIIIVVVLLGGLFAAKTFLLKPPPIDEKKLAKEPGDIYVIAEPFVVNLHGEGGGVSHFVKADIALRFSKLSSSLLAAGGAHGGGAEPVKIHEDPELRDIIISILAAQTPEELLTEKGRHHVKEQIVKTINKKTEIKIVEVYYNSLAVQ